MAPRPRTQSEPKTRTAELSKTTTQRKCKRLNASLLAVESRFWGFRRGRSEPSLRPRPVPGTGLEPPSQCRPELWTAEHSTPSLADHNSDPTVPSLVRKRSEDTEPVSKGGRPSGASVAVAEDGARLPGPHRVRPADEARCPALGLPRAVPSPPRLLGPQVTQPQRGASRAGPSQWRPLLPPSHAGSARGRRRHTLSPAGLLLARMGRAPAHPACRCQARIQSRLPSVPLGTIRP